MEKEFDKSKSPAGEIVRDRLKVLICAIAAFLTLSQASAQDKLNSLVIWADDIVVSRGQGA